MTKLKKNPMVDTPIFDHSGAEELSDGQEVFVIDTNGYDIYEAVVYLKEAGSSSLS